MKTSELIKDLQNVLEKQGDLPVEIVTVDHESTDSDSLPAYATVTIVNENNRPSYVLICDEVSRDAFGYEETNEKA